MVSDAAPVYPGVLNELVPSSWPHVEQYANNPVEADHGQLKRRMRPMRGLQSDRTAKVVIAGHAFVQNLHRGHYEFGVEAHPALRVAAAFTELAAAMTLRRNPGVRWCPFVKVTHRPVAVRYGRRSSGWAVRGRFDFGVVHDCPQYLGDSWDRQPCQKRITGPPPLPRPHAARSDGSIPETDPPRD